MIKHHHKCDHCGKGMSEGFYDDGTYYCSVECLLAGNIKRLKGKPYTFTDWEKDHEEHPDDCYWTAWEDGIEDGEEFYNAEGRQYGEDGEMYPEDAAFEQFNKIMRDQSGDDFEIDRDSFTFIAETENTYIIQYAENRKTGFLNVISKTSLDMDTLELTIDL